MYSMKNSNTFYVSQSSGNDYFSGLAPAADEYGNGPFQTLDRALRLIRQMRLTGVDKPLTIELVDDYYLSAPLSLTNGLKRLTIESYGSRKRIIGGVRIEGWQRDTFHDIPCFSAKLPEKEDGGAWAFTDLFVNGKRAKTTRYPKEGMLYLVDTEEQIRSGVHFHAEHNSGNSKWFIVHPEDLAELDRIEDATINYYHYWIDEHSPIESYDRESGKLVMAYTSRFSCSAIYEKDSHGATKYYLTNVPNTFGAPCEWYLDREAQTVYYIPEDPSISPEEIEAFAPTVSHLFEIEGEDLRIRDLELTCTTGDYASITPQSLNNELPSKPIQYGGDIQSVCWAPAAIRIQQATRCEISDCYLHGLGIHGIEIGTACRNVRIEDNHIEDICAGGIKILGRCVDEDTALTTANCTIRGNHIHHCGRRYAAGCGILAMHTSDNEIFDNEIHDLEYSGISAGWVWGYTDSTSYGNRILRNHIYNIGNGNLSDMGGIYLLGRQRGTVVAENRIHDVTCFTYGAWGIYLDEGSSYITVEKNVIYRTGRESLHLHYGSHNVVKNNIFFGGASGCVRVSKDEYHEQIVLEQNIMITDGAPFYTRRGAHTLASRRNILWDRSGNAPILFEHKDGTRYDRQTWQETFGHDKGSLFADPKLERLEDFDFTLAQDSPALSLGFQPLPVRVAKPQ